MRVNVDLMSKNGAVDCVVWFWLLRVPETDDMGKKGNNSRILTSSDSHTLETIMNQKELITTRSRKLGRISADQGNSLSVSFQW